MLTIADVSQAVPANMKTIVSQSFVDTINNLVADPDHANVIRDNFISYASVLRDGKYKMTDYLNAITYMSYKMQDMTNHDAWCLTFPQRHAALTAAGKTKKEVSSHVSMYAKGKLVLAVAEVSFTPIWLVNRDIHQKAINQLADKMMNAASEKVQVEAAGLLLAHLAKPKESGPLINIQLGESSGMNEMKSMLESLALQQQQLIQNGATTKDIAGQRIFENAQ